VSHLQTSVLSSQLQILFVSSHSLYRPLANKQLPMLSLPNPPPFLTEPEDDPTFHIMTRTPLNTNAFVMHGIWKSLSPLCCLLLGLVADRPCAYAEESIDLDSAIAAIAAKEQAFEKIAWHVSFREGRTLEAREPPWSIANEDCGISAKVQIDAQRRKYHAAFTTVGLYIDTDRAGPPTPEHIGQSAEYAFDGQLYRHWHSYSKDASIPTSPALNAYATGEISTTDAERLSGVGFLGAYGRPLGIHYMPPYFTLGGQSTPLRLSTQLRANADNGKRCDIKVTASGVWLISAYGRTGPDGIEDWWDIEYDCRDGSILSARRYNSGSLTRSGAEFVLERIYYTHEKKGGVSLPRLIQSLNPGQHQLYEWAISDVQVNPDFGPKAFLINFPPGVRVVDHANKMVYVTGQTLSDEQRAVQSYLRQFGQRSTDVGVDNGRGSFYRLVGVLLTALLIFVLVLAKLRRRRTNGMAAVAALLAAIPLLADTCLAGVHQDINGECTVSNSPGEAVRVTQCGVLTAIYTLEVFGVSYDVGTVARALPPASQGTNLGDIAELLTAYGLTVQARKDVTKKGLEQTVSQELLAIVPVSIASGVNHYVVAHVTSLGVPAIFDVPKSVYGFDEALKDAPLNNENSVVLFVTHTDGGSRRSSTTSEVVGRVDLGNVAIPVKDDPGGLFYIRNTGTLPLLISRVSPACGCLKLTLDQSPISPGEKRRVSVTMDPRGLGAGRVRIGVGIDYVNAASDKVMVQATIQDNRLPHPLQGLSVWPTEAGIVVGNTQDDLASGDQVRFEVRCDREGRYALQNVHCARWLKVDAPPQIENGSAITVSPVLDAFEAESRKTGVAELYTTVDIKLADTGDREVDLLIPVTVRVRSSEALVGK